MTSLNAKLKEVCTIRALGTAYSTILAGPILGPPVQQKYLAYVAPMSTMMEVGSQYKTGPCLVSKCNVAS